MFFAFLLLLRIIFIFQEIKWMRFDRLDMFLLFLMGFYLRRSILLNGYFNLEVVINLKGAASIGKYPQVEIVTLKIWVIILSYYDLLIFGASLIIFIVW